MSGKSPVLDPNGRTHEPSLREAVSELDGLRALMLEKFTTIEVRAEERHQRYTERFEAQKDNIATALAHQEKQVNAAFTAVRDANAKLEITDAERFRAHNGLIEQMAKAAATYPVRPEMDAVDRRLTEKIEAMKIENADKIDLLRKQIADLRESRSLGTGRDQQVGEGREQTNWTIALVVLGAIQAASLVVAIVTYVR